MQRIQFLRIISQVLIQSIWLINFRESTIFRIFAWINFRDSGPIRKNKSTRKLIHAKINPTKVPGNEDQNGCGTRNPELYVIGFPWNLLDRVTKYGNWYSE